MKKLILLTIIGLFTIYACRKENVKTGFVGKVCYGHGDCQPTNISRSNKDYKKYKSTLYFIDKNVIKNLGWGDLDSLKKQSISCEYKNGKYSIELLPNEYVVMTKDAQNYDYANSISINSGQVIKKDLKLWNCESY